MCYIQQTTTLENAHNSRVDARAQAQVVFHEYFHNYIDKSKSIVAMDKILMVKHKNHEKCNEEAKRQVPGGQKEDDTTIWELPEAQSYTSVMGGPKEPGPSTTIKSTIANQPVSQCELVALFLFFLPMQILQATATATEKYGRKDWVLPCAKK